MEQGVKVPNLVSTLNQLMEAEQNNELIENQSTTSLNYQFMYKQLESAIEEILVKYPNDPVVKELKQNLLRNLRPILEQLNQ